MAGRLLCESDASTVSSARLAIAFRMLAVMSDLPVQDDAVEFMAELVAHQRRIFGHIGSLLPAASDHEDVYQQTCMAI